AGGTDVFCDGGSGRGAGWGRTGGRVGAGRGGSGLFVPMSLDLPGIRALSADDVPADSAAGAAGPPLVPVFPDGLVSGPLEGEPFFLPPGPPDPLTATPSPDACAPGAGFPEVEGSPPVDDP